MPLRCQVAHPSAGDTCDRHHYKQGPYAVSQVSSLASCIAAKPDQHNASCLRRYLTWNNLLTRILCYRATTWNISICFIEKDPDRIYGGLLTVLMRLVFLLYAVDRLRLWKRLPCQPAPLDHPRRDAWRGRRLIARHRLRLHSLPVGCRLTVATVAKACVVCYCRGDCLRADRRPFR
jgi:hypothetical protein